MVPKTYYILKTIHDSLIHNILERKRMHVGFSFYTFGKSWETLQLFCGVKIAKFDHKLPNILVRNQIELAQVTPIVPIYLRPCIELSKVSTTYKYKGLSKQ